MTKSRTNEEQTERLVHELDKNFVIEASAGTGKTTSLVRRVIATIRSGADIRRIVAVTFTDRAASELKLRVRSELLRAAREEPEHTATFERAIEHLEQASISTIHRFASDLLRRYALDLGLDPDVRVATHLEVRALREEAFREVTSELLQAGDPRIERAFARADMTLARLRRASGSLLDYRSYRGAYATRALPDELEPSSIARRISAFVAAAKRRPSKDHVGLLVSRFEALARRFDLGVLDPFDLDASLVALAREQKNWKLPRASSRPDAEEAARDVILALLPRYAEASSAELARELQSALDPVIDVYTRAKRARGLVDFDDLLFFARDLLLRDARVRSAVREHYTNIFVDEFQDTDRIQAELLMLIASDVEPDAGAELSPLTLAPRPGKLLIVGDPKQSIYRFRNADPATYDAVRSHVLSHGGELLVLSTSWRSTPGILAYVNRVFARAMKEDGETHQPGYAALAPRRPELGEQPGVIALPIPEPYGRSRLSKAAVMESLPPAVASFIAWLPSSPLRVEDRTTGEPRPIEPRDVAILFRQVADFGESKTTPFSLALSAAGIPHIVIGGHSVAERGEAHAIIVALRAIENPRDRLLVYATLKGLLFGIPDDLLLSWQRRFGPIGPLRLPITAVPERLCIIRDALVLLGDLHRKRNERSAAETLQALLEATRAEVAIALTATPAQGFLQVQSLFQRAFEHDRSGGISFRAFARELADPSAFESTSFDDLDDDEVSGVKLLTVHRAKGLEFPVVILADPETNRDREPERVMVAERGVAAIDLAGQKPWDLIEGADSERARAAAESLRCAYVAATRARDLLVVPFVGDDAAYPEAGWLTALTSSVLEAPRTLVDSYGFAGDDVVLKRPATIDRSWVFKPGLYGVAGSERVLVLDPKHLARASVGSQGVSALQLIAKEHGESAASAAEEMEAHLASNDAARQTAAEPLCVVETATARSHRAPEARAEVAALTVFPRPRSVGGKRFGTLVHGILAYVPLDAQPAVIEAFARSFGGLCDATEDEILEAIHVAGRVLASEVFDLARKAIHVHRELSVTFVAPDGAVVDGIIDLALELEDRVAVYDFKTDDQNRLTAEHRERYEAQVTLYADALARQFQKPITRALLFV